MKKYLSAMLLILTLLLSGAAVFAEGKTDLSETETERAGSAKDNVFSGSELQEEILHAFKEYGSFAFTQNSRFEGGANILSEKEGSPATTIVVTSDSDVSFQLCKKPFSLALDAAYKASILGSVVEGGMKVYLTESSDGKSYYGYTYNVSGDSLWNMYLLNREKLDAGLSAQARDLLARDDIPDILSQIFADELQKEMDRESLQAFNDFWHNTLTPAEELTADKIPGSPDVYRFSERGNLNSVIAQIDALIEESKTELTEEERHLLSLLTDFLKALQFDITFDISASDHALLSYTIDGAPTDIDAINRALKEVLRMYYEDTSAKENERPLAELFLNACRSEGSLTYDVGEISMPVPAIAMDTEDVTDDVIDLLNSFAEEYSSYWEGASATSFQSH